MANPLAEELNQARDDLIRAFEPMLGKDADKTVSILERFIDANIRWQFERPFDV